MRQLSSRALALLLGACTTASPPPAAEPSAPPRASAQPSAPAPSQVFAADAPRERFEDPERRRKLLAALPAIDAMVDAELVKQKLPGVALGVVIDGELVHTRSAGMADLAGRVPVDADTIFRVGSISKVFTAEAVLMLREQGKLELDAPASSLVPELASLVYPTADSRRITLRQLLTHSAGLPRETPSARGSRRIDDEGELLAAIPKLQLLSSPGESYAYSNLGFALLGITVARASGEPYARLVERRLLAPLGMTSSSFDPAPSRAVALGYRERDKLDSATRLGVYDSAGGLSSSVRDLARFMAFQLSAYPARNEPDPGPLPRSVLREAHRAGLYKRMGVRASDAARRGESAVHARADSIGLGWQSTETCELDPIVWHNGKVDGFSSYLALLPRHGVGIVALTNLRDGEPDEIVERALALLVQSGGLAPRKPVVTASAELSAALDRLLAVQNGWDLAAYEAMLSDEHRQKVPVERERAELAEYVRRHGACKAGPVVEANGPAAASFALACERGRLVMSVSVAEDGKIAGFGGQSYDLVPAPLVLDAAKRVASLVERWSDGTHRASFAADFAIPKPELQAVFDKLRARHGACTVGASRRTDGPWAHRFELACDRGEPVELALTVSPAAPHRVSGLRFERVGQSKCPLR